MAWFADLVVQLVIFLLMFVGIIIVWYYPIRRISLDDDVSDYAMFTIALVFVSFMVFIIYNLIVYNNISKDKNVKDKNVKDNTTIKNSTIFIQSNDDSIYDPDDTNISIRESYILNYTNGSFLDMDIPGGKPVITTNSKPLNNFPVINQEYQESVVVVDKDNNTVYCLIANTYTSECPPIPDVDGSITGGYKGCAVVTYTKGDVWYLDNTKATKIWKITTLPNTYTTDSPSENPKLDQTIVCYNNTIYKIDFPKTNKGNITIYTLSRSTVKDKSSGSFVFDKKDSDDDDADTEVNVSYSVSSNVINNNKNVLLFTVWPSQDLTSNTYATKSWITTFDMKREIWADAITSCNDGVYTASAPAVGDNFYILRADMLCGDGNQASCGINTSRCYGLRMFNTKSGFIPSSDYEKNIVLDGGSSAPGLRSTQTGETRPTPPPPTHPIYQMYVTKNKLYLPYSPALYELDISKSDGCTITAKNILPTLYKNNSANDGGTDPAFWDRPPPFNESGDIAIFNGKKDADNYILMISPSDRRLTQKYEKNDKKIDIWKTEKSYIYSGKPTLNVMSSDLYYGIIIIPRPESSTNDRWDCPGL
jgi:hypothetical protein